MRTTAAAAVVAVGLALGAAPAAHAVHDTPPARTITYDVQLRGTVATDLEELAQHAATTFRDVRGWSLGGSLGYVRVPAGGDFTLWLAEASTVPSFSPSCSSSWSCRVGRHVIINETRWRTATPSWTRSLDEYRHYVVNHELGHWHGRGHESCPGAGQPAPVMQQQSISLQGCVSNVWPLPWERDAVARTHGVGIRPDLFPDIAGSVHAEAIRSVADAGIAAGWPDGTYRPDVDVSRGQLATHLVRVTGLPPTGSAGFPDLGDSVHADSIRALADAGLASGFTDGTFRPHDAVRRGQLATLLAGALRLDTGDASCAPPDSATSVHAGAVCALLTAGIADGAGGGGFGPDGTLTRGQLASFLARAKGLPH